MLVRESDSDSDMGSDKNFDGGDTFGGGPGSSQRNKSGRKRNYSKPSDKRTHQNRLAQRAFRERRQNHVKFLEAKVQELTEIIAGNPPKSSRERIVKPQLDCDAQNRGTNPDHLLTVTTTTDIAGDIEGCGNCAKAESLVKDLIENNHFLEKRNLELSTECERLKMLVQQSTLSTDDCAHHTISISSFLTPEGNHHDFGAQPAPNQIFSPTMRQTDTPNAEYGQPSMFRQSSSFAQNLFNDTIKATPTSLMDTGKILPEWNFIFDSAPKSTLIAPTTVIPSPAPSFASSNNVPRFSYSSHSNGDLPSAMNTESPQMSSLSDDWYDMVKNDRLVTSEELFGPISTGDAKIALKQVPSLLYCTLVDEMMDSYVALSKSATKKALGKHLLRIAASKHKILDICKIVDRTRVIEIIEEFKGKYSDHMRHIYYHLYHSFRRERTPEHHESTLNFFKQFRKNITNIPALANHEDTVDELCVAIAETSLTLSKKEKINKLITFIAIVGQLQCYCNDDERKMFMLEMEAMRVRCKAVQPVDCFGEVQAEANEISED